MKKWALSLVTAVGLLAGSADAQTWYNRFRDAGDIPFTQSGTGATTRDVKAALSEWHSINSYSTLANALTAAGAGASVVIPYGTYTLPATVLGNGQSITGMHGDRPSFTYSPTTGNALTLIGDSSTLRGVDLTQSGTAVSSVGVTIGAGELGQSPTIRDVKLSGFATAIDGVSNVIRRLDNVNVQSIKSGGLGVRWRNPTSPDSGDDFWSGVTIDGTTPGATNLVSYESGGGLKIVGMKGLGANIGFLMNIPDGVATQDFMMVGSSIENSTTACMKFQRSGTTGVFGQFTITGSQFAGCPIAQWFANAGVSNGYVGGNAYSSISTVPIRLDPGANNVVVGLSAYGGATYVVDNRTAFTDEGGRIDRRDTYPKINLSTTPTTVYTVVVPAYRTAHVDVLIEGLIQSVGSFTAHESFELLSDGTTLLVANWVDMRSGSGVNFAIDTSTTPGTAYLKFSLGSGTGSAVVHIDVTGKAVSASR